MKLFTGEIEVKETDTIKVYRDFLEVRDKNKKETYYENSGEFWIKREYDKNGNQTYLENSNKFWSKCEFDKNGNVTYYEDSDGYWVKKEYDKNDNEIYYENSKKYWAKKEYDKNGNRIYYENSYGTIIDNRAKEMTVAEIEKELGYKIKIKGE